MKRIFFLTTMLLLTLYLMLRRTTESTLNFQDDSNTSVKHIATPDPSRNPQDSQHLKNKNMSGYRDDQNEKNIKEVTTCFPKFQNEFSTTGKLSLNKLLALLKEEYGEPLHNISLWNNFHIKKEDGTIFRMNISSRTTQNEKEVKDLKLFTVDNEGLPVPFKELHNATEDSIKSYLSEGDIIYRDKVYNLIFKENNNIRVKEENAHISEMEITSESMLLNCFTNDNNQTLCECLK